MSYGQALRAAGATLEEGDMEHFGSYQGEWLAKVTVGDRAGIIAGAFGSCSYCDAFEAEFGYRDRCDEHYGDITEGCAQCAREQVRLAAFGQSYLDGIIWLDDDAAMQRLIAEWTDRIEWDYEARQVLAWIEARR